MVSRLSDARFPEFVESAGCGGLVDARRKLGLFVWMEFETQLAKGALNGAIVGTGVHT